MPKFYLSILLCFTFYLVKSQNLIKNYVKQNTSQILTIEPDSTDYADLQSIGDAIGNAKIIMLGEQYHGDAATFLAKSRLIKYLHEKKGFNVLAFESDFFALNEGWDKLPKIKKDIDSFMYNNPFPIWSWCNTCSNLFYTYVAETFKTANPLQITGFDCQVHGLYSVKNMKRQLDSVFNIWIVKQPEISEAAKSVILFLDSLNSRTMTKDSNICNTLIKNLTIIFDNIKNINTFDHFWVQIIKSLLTEATEIKAYLLKDKTQYHIRDMQMAENIDWLCKNKYINEKIIIWAHNAHVAKNTGDIFNFSSSDNNMMGSYIDRNPDLKSKVYIMGFTSYEGSSSFANTTKLNRDLEKPKKNSFENWIDRRYDYAFVDFKKFNELNPGFTTGFFMKGSIYSSHHNYIYNWTNIFDGVFFIRQMYGCKQPFASVSSTATVKEQ